MKVHAQRLPATALIAGVIFFFCAWRPAAAQGFQPGRWDGSLELLGDYVRTDTETNGSELNNENTRTEERITLRNTGAYVIDPRLITMTLGGTFGLSQEEATAKESGRTFEDSRDGDLNGYDAYLGVLPGNAMSLSIFANRNQFVQTREFAGRTDIDIENRGATLYARRLYVPSTLTFRQELNDEESRVRGIVSRRDEHRDILTYDGRRGWVNSEMNLRYESIDKSDKVRPELDYKRQTGNVYYSLDFGPELNWRWDSRIRGFDRTGFSEEERVDIDELLRIDHSKRLRSQYRYFFVETDRPEGETTTHTGEFNLRHQLYESLVTKLRLDAIDQTNPNGDKELYAGRLSFDYNKSLPRSGRLLAALALYYAEEDNEFDAFTSRVSIFREVHTFQEPFALPEQLDNPLVFEDTVEITRTALGSSSQCDVARPLVENVDYRLETVNNFTRVVPLADCSIDPSIGIGPGDTIEVDYEYELIAPAFTSKSWRLNIALDYGWIRPFFIHDKQDQDLDEGEDDSFLNDRQSDILGVELKYDGPRLRASLLAEAERWESRDTEYDAIRARQFLAYRFAPDWRVTFDGEQSIKDFTFPEDRKTDILAGRATLIHNLRANLSTELYASLRDLDDTLVPDERIREAGLLMRWRYGRLHIDPSLKYIDRRRDGSDLKDYRATLRVIRNF